MKAETKIFKNNKITIRPFSVKDLKCPEKFQNFINSFVEEKALILKNKKINIKQESIFIKNSLKRQKNKKGVYLVTEDENKNAIIGITNIALLGDGVKGHVGNMGILIRKDYRNIGVGNFLSKEIIKLSKKN